MQVLSTGKHEILKTFFYLFFIGHMVNTYSIMIIISEHINVGICYVCQEHFALVLNEMVQK